MRTFLPYAARFLMLRCWCAFLPLSVIVVLAGCHDLSGLAGKQEFPSGTIDPKSFKTAEGAMALYQAELSAFQYSSITPTVGGDSHTTSYSGAFVTYVMASGLLSDELQDPCLRPTPGGSTSGSCTGLSIGLDTRQLPEGNASDVGFSYTGLQSIRNGANLAIGALAAYDSSASPALRGHMFALKGYAEIMLADLYCSGVPLSSVDFNGDFTYRPGSTTDEIYRDAQAQFDQAISLSADSSRILNLARVGKARALLDRGLVDSAAIAVTDVPDGFTYQFPVDWTGFTVFLLSAGDIGISVANQEGWNGLPYRTDGATDPRVTSKQYGTNAYGLPVYTPAKYGTTSGAFAGTVAPTIVADWIEARLIRAEAALAAGDISGWLGQLNYLRANAIIPALPTLIDPGTSLSRVMLLFHERAYWLFLTGHRQGDMRRLVRQYGPQFGFGAGDVYPTGAYPYGVNASVYGSDVNAPIPPNESKNPLFTGCLSREA